ncbi:MAG TPA: DUF2275 domain-containing protein [Nitrospirota bacterium]|nr:DUF2275 domain-containing protein [Nitrospirota bacterium]
MRHKLSEYIDGSIPSAAKAEIEEHLKTCAACSDALRELERTIEHIKTVEQVEPPAWMTQKTMAKVRAETERRRRGFLFFPVRAKLPIQIFAVLFLTVIAFYIYRNIQPTPNLSEAPTREAPSSVIAKDELGKTDRSSPRSEKAPQTQKYKALDMKLEYEKPAPPIPREQPAAPAQQPPQAANEDVLGKGAAKPQAAAPPPIQERAAPSAGPEPQAGAKSKTISPLEKTAGLSARTDMQGNLERVALESHSNGTPKLIVTYEVVDLRKVKLAEERFNIKGERHGIQREYYESGQVKTEAQYGHGKLKWFKEFSPDGVERSGRSNYDWFWLKE